MIRGWRRRRQARGTLSRYLGADEYVRLSTRQHPMALTRVAGEAFGLIVPLATLAWGVSGIEVLRGDVGTWSLRIVFAAMFFLLARLAWRVVEWEFERIFVTNHKVIHAHGVLSRRIASTPLSKASEFSVHQPALGRVMDYGSLVVDVPGGRVQALHGLRCLPDPVGIYRLVSDQSAEYRRQARGSSVPVAAPIPTDADLARMHRPDPWQPTLEGDAADHTIQIPRILPPTH